MRRENLLLVGCVILVLAFGGCWHNNNFVHVYLDDDCQAEDKNGNVIDDLEVSPGDIIVWHNKRSDAQTVKFATTEALGTMEVPLAPGTSKLSLVQLGAGGDHGFAFSPCGEGGVGTPKLKVGDDPEP